MSDEESSGSEQEEVAKPSIQAAKKKKPSSMPKTAGLDEASVELLESNRKDRDKMEDEIQELRARAEKRKKQRDIEEKRLAAERAAEDEKRKAAEEERKKKKEEDELRHKSERAKKQAELEKMRDQTGPNFVIKKKEREDAKQEQHQEQHEVKDKKSREQLEAEKKAILSQRIQPLEISGFDSNKLKEKAKDLLKVIYKLEGEKYDLEKRFKTQQVDMMELAEKARQANKVGKGGLKRVQQGEEVDVIQTKFAGTPAKIEMYSKYERQTDKREYSEKKDRFAGPQFINPADRIKPKKSIKWDDDRIPLYCEGHEAGAEETAQPAE